MSGPTQKAYYRARFLGDSDLVAVTGANRLVTPKVALSTPVAPTSAYANYSFTVYGYIKPKHTTGTNAVLLKLYRYQSGGWVYRGYANARISYVSSTMSKYSASMNIPRVDGSGRSLTGYWKVSAFHDDAGHAATTSGYDSFRIN